MRQILITFILLTICVRGAVAEPDAAARFLMNDSVSLLDFGIYRLENDIRANRDRLTINHKPPDTVFVDYNWDENRIVIGLSYGVSGNPPQKEIRPEIKTVFETMRANFGIDPKGSTHRQAAASRLPEYFSHRAYVSKNRPPALENEIDRMTQLKVIYHVQNYSRYFECVSMLVDQGPDEMNCTDYLP